jgi:2-methylcitrate dehydratase PrpD
MIHLEDFDDSYFAARIHPTAAVCGALLPFAYDAKCTGQQFLEAVSIGTEVEIAVGLGLVPTAYDRGFHLTSVAGGVGAAVGCGLIQGLGVDKLEAAIGIALGSSVGYTVMFGSDMKAYGVGNAARAGVVAVGLAARGFTSAPDAIEGLGGVVSAMCNDADDAVARMAAAIGELGTTAAQGIINYAVPKNEIDGIVNRLVKQLLARTPTALARTKRLCNKHVIQQWNLTQDLAWA